jgi:hypothetical protein
MERVQRSQDKINAFWKAKRNAAEMDEVYSQLLRSGKSTVKRHYELTGSLSATEEAQDPEYARMQKLLAQEATEEEKKAAAAAVAKTKSTATTTTATSDAAAKATAAPAAPAKP